MVQNVVFVGSGAQAAELTSYIDDTDYGQTHSLCVKGYLEYEHNIEKYWKKYGFKKPVLGDVDTYEIVENDVFVIAIAHVEFRKKMINILKSKGAHFINLVHPSVVCAHDAKLGEGNIIYPFCMIGPKTVLGDFNVLTSYSFVSHDCKVGSNNFLSTCGLAGHVEVGDDNMFGIRSTVIPDCKIGDANIIQAGMTIDKNIGNNTTVFYRYKEQVLAIPQS